MRHVAPHHWADAASGRISLDDRARMTAHAAECARCARERDRVLGARAAFEDIVRAPGPELRWEQVGARVYWASSQERRARESGTMPALRAPRRRWWLALPGLALAAGAAAAAVTFADVIGDDEPRPVAAEAAPAPLEALPVVLVELDRAPVPRVGLVTLAQGDAQVAGVSGADVLAQPVTAGLRLGTAEGRLAVQLDAGTAFAIGPRTTLDVARLDDAAIELHVDGEISVEVSRRAPDQRFVVVAGERTVEVRGTAFEVVHHQGRVEVRCRHGLVAVRQGDDVVEVGAGKAWAAAAGEPLLARAPGPLSADDVAAAAERAPVLLPAWTDAPSLLRTTGPVAVAAPRGRAVRIDGVTVGRGAMTVRVMSGRHLVEAERAPGRYAPGQWVATRDDGAPAEIALASAEAPARGAAARRRAQLDRKVDHQQVASCLRGLAKQGLAEGTHVVLEVGVDDTGAISFLNIESTDLPRTTAACVRDVVATVRFPAGPAATWKHRFQF